MRVAGALLSCGALLSGVACGGPPAGPADPAHVVVPSQPPQPRVAPPSPSPVIPIVAAPAFRCESGKRFEVAGRSYCAYDEVASWEAAERRCVGNGGHLMALDTEVTSTAVHKALGSPVGGERAAWMGLQLVGKGAQGKWRWTTGEDLAAASWNAGEPNNFDGNEGCGEWLIADGRWNDTRCHLPQPYLCQAKADKPLGCRRGRAFSAGGMSYCLNTVDLAWTEARRACTADGGSLAVLRTSAENTSVREAMAARFSATKMWIGLTDAAEEGNWSWISGGPVGFTAWHSGEPNDFNREDCGQLYSDSWTWNDLDCSIELPSVCESPATRR
jgi:hypothetical protein